MAADIVLDQRVKVQPVAIARDIRPIITSEPCNCLWQRINIYVLSYITFRALKSADLVSTLACTACVSSQPVMHCLFTDAC